jgi:hypothetical protein
MQMSPVNLGSYSERMKRRENIYLTVTSRIYERPMDRVRNSLVGPGNLGNSIFASNWIRRRPAFYDTAGYLVERVPSLSGDQKTFDGKEEQSDISRNNSHSAVMTVELDYFQMEPRGRLSLFVARVYSVLPLRRGIECQTVRTPWIWMGQVMEERCAECRPSRTHWYRRVSNGSDSTAI